MGLLAAQAVRGRGRPDPRRRAQVLARRGPARPRPTSRRYAATGIDLAERGPQPPRVPRRRPRAGRVAAARSSTSARPAEFNGELLAPAALPQEGAQRGGHVPGAANIPWATAVKDDGTFKDADELSEIYGAKGITPDKDVIAYCRIGERSSHTWFVLHELLGFERVRNYDGSWTEYGSLVGVPIEKSVPVAATA